MIGITKAGRRGLAAITALCMAAACSFTSLEPVFAASDFQHKTAENGLSFEKVPEKEQPVFLIFGESVKNGDGLQKSWKALTQNDLDAIQDGDSAAAFFGSGDPERYWREDTYTLRNSAGKTAVRQAAGLNLEEVADCLGVSLSPTSKNRLRVVSKDGSEEKIKDIFASKRYAYLDAAFPTEVKPVLELQKGKLPSLRLGQETEKQVNAGAWSENVNQIQFDAITSATVVPSVVFTATINGKDYNYTIGDVIHAGQYQAVYHYDRKGVKTVAHLTGIPLEKLLAAKGIRLKEGDFIRTKAKTAEDGTAYQTISCKEMKRCFVAYDGTEELSDAAAAKERIRSRTEFCFYGPDTHIADYWGVDVKTMPEAPASLQAASAGHDSIALRWKAVPDADGYEIYNLTTKKSVLISKGATAKYTAKKLTSGKKYSYKIRAYKDTASGKLYSSYSAVRAAKPVPAKPKLKSVKKGSGKSLNVTWSRVSGASGYQILYSTNANFKKSGTKSTLVKKGTTVKKSLKSLKKGKCCYVKVRAYKQAKGMKVYGDYSSVKKKKL